MYKKYGFVAKRFTVLKVSEEDTKELCNLYRKQPRFQMQGDEITCRKLIKEGNDDFYQEVTYVIRDKSGKMIGVVELESEDTYNADIAIWIPNKAKQIGYINEVMDSMIEWCEEQGYESIMNIRRVDEITRSGTTYTELKKNIVLNSAS